MGIRTASTGTTVRGGIGARRNALPQDMTAP